MRSCIVSLVAALAFTLVGCGDDEDTPTPCEAACEHGKKCGYSAEETSECLQTCTEIQAPDSFFRCVSGLSCEQVMEEDAPMELCGDELIEPHCTQACANLEACAEPWTPEESRDCAIVCSMAYPPEMKQCLLEAEECSEVLACVGW